VCVHRINFKGVLPSFVMLNKNTACTVFAEIVSCAGWATARTPATVLFWFFVVCSVCGHQPHCGCPSWQQWPRTTVWPNDHCQAGCFLDQRSTIDGSESCRGLGDFESLGGNLWWHQGCFASTSRQYSTRVRDAVGYGCRNLSRSFWKMGMPLVAMRPLESKAQPCVVQREPNLC